MKRESDRSPFDDDAEERAAGRLSKSYRSIAVETTPPHLNRAVLAASKTAVRKTGGSGIRNSWPAALAVLGVACLGIVIVLELGQNVGSDTIIAPGAEMGGNTGPMPTRETDSLSGVEMTNGCDEDQSRDEASWTRCIEDLRKRGFADAAENESRRLMESRRDQQPAQQ